MLQKNGFKCPNCEITHKTQKKTFEQYWKEFKAAGLNEKYEINPEEYSSSNGMIHAKCKKCGNIRYSRARSIIEDPNCKECLNKEKSYSESFVKEELLKKYQGRIELLEFNGYSEIGTVKCNVCGKVQQKIIGRLLKKGNETGCRYCRLSNQVGELHPSWTGGTQDISDYFRSAVYRTWRKDSLDFYGNKCVITNSEEDIIVHHLNKSFLEIEEEVFKEFGYSKTTIVKDIDKEDLPKMRQRIQQLHYQNGYGIPLTDCLHKEFHSIYGKTNNTPEQFLEFAKNKGANFNLFDNLLIKIEPSTVN